MYFKRNTLHNKLAAVLCSMDYGPQSIISINKISKQIYIK